MLGRPPTSALFPYTTLFRSVYRVDLQTRQTELWDKVESDIHPSGYEVEQVTYPSKDGTPISMFLAHKKGLQRNGQNPTCCTPTVASTSARPLPPVRAGSSSWSGAA